MYDSSYAPLVSKPMYLSWYNLSYKQYDKALDKTFAFSLKTSYKQLRDTTLLLWIIWKESYFTVLLGFSFSTL